MDSLVTSYNQGANWWCFQPYRRKAKKLIAGNLCHSKKDKASYFLMISPNTTWSIGFRFLNYICLNTANKMKQRTCIVQAREMIYNAASMLHATSTTEASMTNIYILLFFWFFSPKDYLLLHPILGLMVVTLRLNLQIPYQQTMFLRGGLI